MTVSRNPVPDGPRGQASDIPLKRGACYIPLVARCRAAIKDLELEGLSRQARTCYVPGMSRVWAPALLQAFGFDPLLSLELHRIDFCNTASDGKSICPAVQVDCSEHEVIADQSCFVKCEQPDQCVS